MEYPKLKLYYELLEMHHIITGEILPLADQVGLNEDDAKLVRSAEQFAREIGRHLDERNIEINKITVKPFNRRAK